MQPLRGRNPLKLLIPRVREYATRVREYATLGYEM